MVPTCQHAHHTVDGRNPAPLEKPWNHDPLAKPNQPWCPMVSIGAVSGAWRGVPEVKNSARAARIPKPFQLADGLFFDPAVVPLIGDSRICLVHIHVTSCPRALCSHWAGPPGPPPSIALGACETAVPIRVTDASAVFSASREGSRCSRFS